MRAFWARKTELVGGQNQAGAVFLEDDQANPVAALVGVGEQGEDGALGGAHPFGDGHRPGCIHEEEHQVGGAAHADLLLEVGFLDGEGDAAAGVGALPLEWGGGADGGIEGEIGGGVFRGMGLDVAAAFAVGAGARTASTVLAHHLIEGSIQPTWLEGFAGGYRFTAFPPLVVMVIKHILDRTHFPRFFGFRSFLLFVYIIVFFSCPCSCDSYSCGV